ncbi:cbb3-type cytochrome oxidase assembly protein CcoS [Thiomicrospira pelophila]|uniref:cbb3-type cytochrome oxidase assembly protein CcoS n=1 Tax=Thiomicrospira pelophila TaxID=934 RepID=UPI0004A6D052|nr:cbb3-type cytochrome oxidase assembly protein CcoS [Thiomicrospira pelophila]
MEIIFITIPLVLIVGGLVVAMFIWMAKKGQFDDLDGAAHRILLDDEDQKTEVESTNSDETTGSDSTKAGHKD